MYSLECISTTNIVRNFTFFRTMWVRTIHEEHFSIDKGRMLLYSVRNVTWIGNWAKHRLLSQLHRMMQLPNSITLHYRVDLSSEYYTFTFKTTFHFAAHEIVSLDRFSRSTEWDFMQAHIYLLRLAIATTCFMGTLMPFLSASRNKNNQRCKNVCDF